MICYLVRHGADDDTVRGGWSASPLTELGISQVEQLSARLTADARFCAAHIYTSDLPRAKQTAEILAVALNLPVTELPLFRETNNGELAGMDNDLANQKYPGLYWSALAWDEHYPGGESPRDFFDRIERAWLAFKAQLQEGGENVMLVTHAGVINAIACIENNTAYTNKHLSYPTKNAEMVAIQI